MDITIYSSFDYLCNESFYIDGIGNIRCPTLRDIRKITYKLFMVYLEMLSLNHEEYLKVSDLYDKYNDLNESDKDKNSLFYLLLYGNPDLLFGMISFFVVGGIKFNKETYQFDIFKIENEINEPIGHIGNHNFENFRLQVQLILGISDAQEKEPRTKNTLAKEMYEKFQKHNAKQKNKKNDENYTLDNMIRKYCTHNKVGINITNVWDMTYYQFISMFSEYCNARQCDFNDMMAVNTFSYKKSSDYKPMDYMKKLRN